MKISRLLKGVFAARKNMTGTVLATTVLALGLLFGAIPVQAQTVEMVGNTAKAIHDLDLNSVTYDVVFVRSAASGTYSDPPIFDFSTATDAKAAVQAVNDVLNAQGNALDVGPSPESALELYRIGFNNIEVHFGGKNLGFDVPFTETWDGSTPDTGSPGVWVNSVKPDKWPFITDTIYANFTIVGTTGSGNLPPTAEAGASVTGVVGTAVSFDGSASSDPDGTIVSWDWNFGDGNTGTGETTSHTYQSDDTYNVTLMVTDDAGATNSDTTTAVIGATSQPPVADTGGPYDGTAGVTLGFDGSESDDPDGNVVQYDWDFGDGNTAIDGGLTPSNTYAVSGDYTVTLTVTDNDNETGTEYTTATIGVGNQPPVAIAGPPVVGTSGITVDFDGSGSSDPDGNIASWDWDFGDSNSDSGENVQHTYMTPGDYTVVLVVTDGAGAQDSDTTAASIDSAAMPPVADANGPYQGVVDLPVPFDGSGSSDPDGAIVEYSWDFGDDTTGTSADSLNSHTYALDGVYNVTLTVKDDEGLTNSSITTASIAIGNQPPTADANGPYGGVVGVAVNFDGTGSSDDGTIVQYDWDFGDGNTAIDGGLTPSNSYAEADIYTVTLTVTDDGSATNMQTTTASIDAANQRPTADAGRPYNGTFGVPVDFDGSDSDDVDGTIVSWDWNFGDDNNGVGEMPSHTYVVGGVYVVTLTVTDDDGAASFAAFTTAAIDMPPPPLADTGGPYPGKVGVAVDFDGSASSDVDGTIVSWDWDFGDDNNGVGEMPSHTYAVTGVYDVVLTVTDNDNATGKSSTQAIIGDGVNLPPTADPGGPYNAEESVAVNFNGRGSSDRDGSIIQYDWDFGDGTTAIDGGRTPSNAYTTAGLYLVTLTVTDNGDATDSHVAVAAIGQGNVPPTADADGPYPGAENQPVQFNGTGSDDADGYLVSASWDFGDDSTAGSGLIPTHTYTEPGPYTAKLTVTDNDGDTDQSEATVVIGDGVSLPPTADANGPYLGVAGALMTFDGTNSSDPDGNIAAWDWAFGDSMTGIGPTPDHTYLAGSIYNVILKVTDDGSLVASDGTTASIGILSLLPTADANGPYPGSVGNDVTFDGTASNDPDGTIARYDWKFGDGNTAMDAGPTPTNAYAASGKYIVSLEVTDDSGETDTDVTTATIGVGNLPPTADAGDAVNGRIRRDITFDGTGSRDLDGIITDYDWEFGDGNTGTGPTPTHTYADVGTYFVALTVADSDDATSSDVTVASVTAGGGGGGDGDNFFGCSIGTSEVKDPILPLIVLLSVIYVIRRQLGCV